MNPPRYRIVLHSAAYRAVDEYRADLASGAASPGAKLRAALGDAGAGPLDAEGLVEALFATKPPCLFAESEVVGDGSDWTARELSLLGDIGVAVDVTIFDDGLHHGPKIHVTPLSGWLLFTPGALLRADTGGTPADWEAVTRDGAIDEDRYAAVVERRVLPLLVFADARAAEAGKRAFVTIPGLGCGQFAGKFHGTVAPFLDRALRRLLREHASKLTHTRAVYFDPYNECTNDRVEYGALSYLVRPLRQGNGSKPQLCDPAAYAEAGDDFDGCLLASFVAWDHVSWPGNDFYAGGRSTDDGVKAAATDSMFAMTGVSGQYDPSRQQYAPPAPYRTWEELVLAMGLRMQARGNLVASP